MTGNLTLDLCLHSRALEQGTGPNPSGQLSLINKPILAGIYVERQQLIVNKAHKPRFMHLHKISFLPKIKESVTNINNY